MLLFATGSKSVDMRRRDVHFLVLECSMHGASSVLVQHFFFQLNVCIGPYTTEMQAVVYLQRVTLNSLLMESLLLWLAQGFSRTD